MSFFINLIEKKKNLLKKENIYFLTIVVIIFFFDRVSKSKIINDFNQSTYYINKYINFDLIWNIGIGFGLFSTDLTLFYTLVTVLIGLVILLLFYFFAESDTLDKLIYSIIIGGAIGNFYDRLIYKAVPDFIDIHYNNFHWFTFNVADIFITIGILIFILRSFFIKN
jgi:signal peptidase II